MALAARISVPVPGSPVPQSLQTLAVVMLGGALGGRWAGLSLLVYLALGAAGLPVFADGAGGISHFSGPTAGYLAGFVLGAWIAGSGVWQGGPPGWRGVPLLAAGFGVAHAAILAAGWARLSLLLGAREAWTQGVAPFLWGGVVKGVAGALLLVAAQEGWARVRGTARASNGPG